jgi:hypothetical protein
MSDVELADRLAQRRARTAWSMGIVFVATQGFGFKGGSLDRAVDIVQLVAWGIWVAILFVFLLYGGGFGRGPAVRALINDEISENNRRCALVGGFWAMLLCVVICYAASFYKPIDLRTALQVLVTVGVGAALIRFGALERKSLAA